MPARAAGGPGFLRHLLVDPYARSAIRLVVHSDLILRQILEQAYGSQHPPLDQRELARWRRPFAIAGSEDALESLAHHEIPGLTRAQLERLHVPAALVFGADDSNVPVSAGRDSAAALGGAPLTLVPGAGHLAPLTAPGAVAAAIERFSRSLPRRR